MKETNTIYKYIYKDNTKETTDIMRKAIENHRVKFDHNIRNQYGMENIYGLIYAEGMYKTIDDALIDFIMDQKYGSLIDRLFDPEMIDEIRIGFNSPENQTTVIFNREKGTRMRYDIDYSDIKVIQMYYRHDNWANLGPFPPLFNTEVEHLQLSYYNTEGAPERDIVYFHKFN